MKRLSFQLAIIIGLLLTGCTNLDDVNNRLDRLEESIVQLQEAFDKGKIIETIEPLTNEQNGWFITFTDNTNLTIVDSFFSKVNVENGFVYFEMTDGRTFMFEMDSDIVTPKLLNMEFLAASNPESLIEDAECRIVGDSIVECWIPNITDNKNLIAHFTFEGEKVLVDGQALESGVSKIDYKKPTKLEIHSKGEIKTYTVYVHSFTGLPILWIETENRAEIVSKDEYLKAHFKLVEDVVTRAPGDVIEVDGQIKGRGNSTWDMPKKPYRLKFDSKVSFLDEPKDKSWVLLANYTDKTSIRNATVFFMGSISRLEYTPRFHFVDVMLNGRYNGTYQLGDKIKVSNDRVNVGDDGFLFEIDTRATEEDDARYFRVKHIGEPVNIKEPEVEYGDEDYNYAKDYITLVDQVLFSDNFADPEVGWQKYMDIDSFVDWYIINEIAKNNDGIFFSSCYMNFERGGKLKMGPLWDYDIALGNVKYNTNYDPEGLWIYNVAWYKRLFEDSAFKEKVKERFEYFYGQRDAILTNINENAKYLKLSVIEDENKWHTFYNYTWPNYDIWGCYMNEVQSMKTWLIRRFDWLKAEFDKM